MKVNIQFQTANSRVLLLFTDCDDDLEEDGGIDYWLDHKVHNKVSKDKNYVPLTPTQVEQVEKFVFFTGYPRSGHSIFGSFIDAHPNVALSYAFAMFRGLMKKANEEGSLVGLLRNKTLFFNTVYERSYWYSTISSNAAAKGYTLDVPGAWSGKFDRKLRVIGDKSATPTARCYSRNTPTEFKRKYDILQQSVGVPLLGIHVVRNPFDMIATQVLYHGLGMSWKSNSTESTPYRNDEELKKGIEFYFGIAQAVQEMVPLCGMNVLEVHSEDVVKDARRQLLRMCEFLQVDCPESYLQACESKVYKSVSRTRDLVYWPPIIRAQVEQKIEKYSFFRGYTFEEDYYNPL